MNITTTKIFKDDYAKQIFEYRRNAVVTMMGDLEVLTVKYDLRKVAYMITSKETLINLQKKYPDLKFIMLDTIALDSFYSITARQPESLDELGFRIAVVKPEFDENLFPYFADESDDRKKGSDLGYPECCIDAFDENWIQNRKIDYTWEQAINTDGVEIEGNTALLKDVPISSNGLTRWMGFKPFFHMPCNFKCEESQKIFGKLKQIALNHGYQKEWMWLEEVLSWEAKWDTLHGIGILVTPVAKVRFSTPYTAEKKEVIKKGTSDVEIYKDWLWSDNSFSNYATMEDMHKPIEDLIYKLDDVENIVDLGCGNGYLLTKFQAETYGIDCNPEVIRRARNHLHTKSPENFVVGDITQFEFDKDFSVAIISAIRLIEMNKRDRMEFVAEMLEHTDHIILTGYKDWLDTYGGLKPLIEKTGFEIIESVMNDKNSAGAAFVRWGK